MAFNTKRFAAKLESLGTANDFVEQCSEGCPLDTQKKFSLLLALEEAFVNICSYAYPDGSGDVEISCNCGEKSFELEVADNGSPFDVLSLPPPDTTLELQDRQPGGLGIHFIRTLSDEVSYRREHEQNILKIVFTIQ